MRVKPVLEPGIRRCVRSVYERGPWAFPLPLDRELQEVSEMPRFALCALAESESLS